MNNTILFSAMLMILPSCTRMPVTQTRVKELVQLSVVRADVDQIHREDSIAATSKTPFSPSTRLVFAVPERDSISITFYDIRGELASRSFCQVLDKGDYQVMFNASACPPGVYFVRYKVGEQVITKKFIIIQ